MDLRQKTIAVTGGAGFIGSHLVDQLAARGNRVVVLDDFSAGRRQNLSQSSSKIIEGDIRDLKTVQKAFDGVEAVFHMATHCVRLSLTDPLTNHEVNGTGTLNCLLAARSSGVKRFVYCSSSEVYGNIQSRGFKTLSEDTPKLPTTVYGASKLVGEHYALAFWQTHGLEAMVVRPFNAYGPRSHVEGPYGEVIPRFAAMIRAGKMPVIFGDGGQTRDFTYVEDTAAGLISCAEKDELIGDSVNLAHGEEVSVMELAKILCELHGVAFNPKFVPDRPGDIRRLGADTTKAKKILGDHAQVSIRAGIQKYLKWLDGQGLDFAALAAGLSDKNWTQPARGTHEIP